jgi:hypothetical protein
MTFSADLSNNRIYNYFFTYIDVLYTAISGDDCILDVLIPEVQLGQITEQVLVYHLELARQHPTQIIS